MSKVKVATLAGLKNIDKSKPHAYSMYSVNVNQDRLKSNYAPPAKRSWVGGIMFSEGFRVRRRKPHSTP
jgi:hypothetical protein